MEKGVLKFKEVELGYVAICCWATLIERGVVDGNQVENDTTDIID